MQKKNIDENVELILLFYGGASITRKCKKCLAKDLQNKWLAYVEKEKPLNYCEIWTCDKDLFAANAIIAILIRDLPSTDYESERSNFIKLFNEYIKKEIGGDEPWRESLND